MPKMYEPVSVFPFAFQSPHDISHSIEFLYFPLFVSVRAYQQLRSPLLSECAYKMERKKKPKDMLLKYKLDQPRITLWPVEKENQNRLNIYFSTMTIKPIDPIRAKRKILVYFKHSVRQLILFGTEVKCKE